MCGIVGKVAFGSEAIPRELIGAMATKLHHRGPDAQGVHVGPHIGLGQTRLAIIDLSESGNPPLSNADDTVWIVFNGEIYNFQELRSLLPDGKYVFKTKTDTEVLLHLYQEFGPKCLQHLRGMFAIAIWDVRAQRLFAARDRLGKKPFYWTKTAQGFVFGSEIKALMADPSVSRQPNFRAIDAYLTHQYVPSPLTAFEGIHKLAPGHWMTCDLHGQISIERYWAPPESAPAPFRSEEEVMKEILTRLNECVRLRLISDVPIGAFLSGGIDSGTVVALMAQQMSQPVKTFSIGFEEEEFNELPYARLVAQKYGTDHQELIVKADVKGLLPKLVEHYNEPFADSSSIPSYYVAEMARRQVTVVLTGDGGDESFAGYSHYQQTLRWQKADAVPYWMRAALGGGLDHILGMPPYNNTLARARRVIRSLAGNLPQRYALQMSIWKPEEKAFAYTRNFAGLADHSVSSHFLTPDWREGMDALQWMMRQDQSRYLPDCLNVKTDIASMANSLELRSPFLDHTLMEFAATIPSSLKLRGGRSKWILRQAASKLLPPELLSKPKTGFGIPLAHWLRSDLRSLAEEHLFDARAQRRDLFQPSRIKTMWGEHQSRSRDWSSRLWELLILEMWFRRFID